MNCLKLFFILVYFILIILGLACVIWMSISELGWSWVVLVLLLVVLFFVWVFLGNVVCIGKKFVVMWIVLVILMVVMVGGVGMECIVDIE